MVYNHTRKSPSSIKGQKEETSFLFLRRDRQTDKPSQRLTRRDLLAEWSGDEHREIS